MYLENIVNAYYVMDLCGSEQLWEIMSEKQKELRSP